MGFGELFLLAVGLSMDAFAVSVCKGLASSKASVRHSLSCGIWFGGFQALMPVIGFFLGVLFADAIKAFDHWIAFILLAIIGANMLKEAFSGCCDCEQHDADFSAKSMFIMAVATSIDALAVGLSFSVVSISVWFPALVIGLVCALLTALGVWLGARLGCCDMLGGRASAAGALVLIGIGVKILHEHGVF